MSKDDDGLVDVDLGEMETIDLNAPPTPQEVQAQQAIKAAEKKRSEDADKGIYGEDAKPLEEPAPQEPELSGWKKFTQALSNIGTAISNAVKAVVNYRKNKQDKEIRAATTREMAGEFSDDLGERTPLDNMLQGKDKARSHSIPKAFGKVTNRGTAPRAAGAGKSTGRGGRG